MSSRAHIELSIQFNPNNNITIREDILKNVPCWRIGRSLHIKPPSPHLALLGKGGGHRTTTPFLPRAAFPVHGASRTLVFLIDAASQSVFAPPAIILPLRALCLLAPDFEAILPSLALLAYTAL